MKRISSSLALAFMAAFMLTACAGSDDNVRPVFRELFDNYNTTTFPEGETPWISYDRTAADTWISGNWSISGGGGSDYGAYLYRAIPTEIQNSAFINPNYNKTDVNCSISARMSANSPDNNNLQLGVILRATGSGSEHYAFVYKVVESPATVFTPTVEIQKVDAAGSTITVLGTAPVASYLVTPFNPAGAHTYRFSVSGTATLTFVGYIDGIQQLPAVTNPDGSAITPPITPITDSSGVYTSGEPGFFVQNANTAFVTRFFIWEP